MLKSFRQMNNLGTKPTKFILCTALSSCVKRLNWHFGLQIHARIVRTGYQDNLFINSALIDLYSKFDAMMEATKVFQGLKRHDQVSWTSIICGCSQNGHAREAILLFKEMLNTQFKPNSFTYVGVISACRGLDFSYEHGKLLQVHIVKLGLESNGYIISSLIDCYSKQGKINQARLLFDATVERDSILLNSMIAGYSQNLYAEEALKVFTEMQLNNINPTDHTLSSILNACGSLTILQQGKQVHALIVKMGSENNIFVASALIDMYSKCGSTDDARGVFNYAVKKNTVLWTSMITAYSQSGRSADALQLFENLVNEEKLIPDHICFTAILTACNHAGFYKKGIEYFNKMETEYGLIPELDQFACLVDLYVRNGKLQKAKKLMQEMPFEPNRVMWSSFLGACKVHGEVELGISAANQLFKMDGHDSATYVTLANIYAEAGLWGKAAEIRGLMKDMGVRKRAAWSSVEVDKRVHVFSVADTSHCQYKDIYLELEKLNFEMKESKNKLKQNFDLEGE